MRRKQRRKIANITRARMLLSSLFWFLVVRLRKTRRLPTFDSSTSHRFRAKVVRFPFNVKSINASEIFKYQIRTHISNPLYPRFHNVICFCMCWLFSKTFFSQFNFESLLDIRFSSNHCSFAAFWSASMPWLLHNLVSREGIRVQQLWRNSPSLAR